MSSHIFPFLLNVFLEKLKTFHSKCSEKLQSFLTWQIKTKNNSIQNVIHSIPNMQRTITIHQYLPNFVFYLIIKLLEALKLGTVIYSEKSQLYGFYVVAYAFNVYLSAMLYMYIFNIKNQ